MTRSVNMMRTSSKSLSSGNDTRGSRACRNPSHSQSSRERCSSRCSGSASHSLRAARLRGVAFQGGEVEVGDPGFADEADQQIPNHLRVGEQALVAVVVIRHFGLGAFGLSPWNSHLLPLLQGGKRRCEKFRPLVIAARSMAAAESIQPWPSKNRNQARVLTLRQLSGNKKLARAIL